MNEQQNVTKSNIYNVILYLGGLVLFLEWLYPIEQVTDTSSIAVFVIYTIFCFFISLLQLKWWASFLLKGFGLLFILNGLYFDMTFLSREWLNYFLLEFTMNANIFISQDWYYLSPLFRSFLFLLLIWLMSYLLHYWFVQMKRIFLFIFLTFVYITVLDTFTLYDAKFAIIRIFIISLVSLAITNFNRDLEREKISLDRIKQKTKWILPIMLTLVFSVLLGLVAPKLDPQWPDPVPFLEGAAEQVGGSGSGTIQKVGYGEDDSQLGGSFIQDDTPVFHAETDQDQYWRIETKEIYTGKGWESSADHDYIKQQDGEIHLDMYHGNVETEESTALIEFQEGQNLKKLVYPYGVKKFMAPMPKPDLFLDQITESIEARENGETLRLDFYQLAYDRTSYSLTALREDPGNDEEEMAEYLHLPDTLPSRVAELAEEITAGYESRYEKTRAIERYFSSHDFTYQTTGVAVPGEDDDYVDQFLFETQVGYCDNFSTSMVVLLRTLDIPARWVKGFTGGEIIGEGNRDNYHIYEVTNSNAHSWVEVYFPESGWVSFEPTQGFSNLTEFHVDQANTDTEDFDAYDDVLDAPETELPETERELEEDETAPAMASPSNHNFSLAWWQWGLIVLVALLIFFVLYKYRFNIKTKLLAMKLNRNQSQEAFQEAYLHLLTVLDHEGNERKNDQTLREYAKRVDAHYGTGEMRMLTAYYERMLYRNEFNPKEMNKLKTTWKKLLKTIMG